MTVANRPTPLAEQQHIVLDDVSWGFYERLLDEVGDRPIRVTFDEGSIEIMSPLPKHEIVKKAIARLLELMAFELRIPLAPYGSTTFRLQEQQKGLEPDECYYLQNAPAARGMQEFDADVHPPPDLAIEVDISSRSIPRQPIYAALGVPELWRYDGRSIHVLVLGKDNRYEELSTSRAFPFLPIRDFERFISRMELENQSIVLEEFHEWVSTLRPVA
jgi:Uma2 family endonuclease